MLNESKKLSINYDFFTYKEILMYKKNLKPIKLVESKNKIDQVRSIKSKEDIEKIKKAVSITEEGLTYIISFIKEGISEKETANELEYFLKKKGAEELSFPVIILFGENTAYPHGTPGEKKLKKGDVVLIDVGIKLNHFCSDMTRTFAYKEATDNFIKDYDYLLKLQKESINTIKPEIKGSFLDIELRKKLKEKKLEEFYNHSLGHGVGVEVHESPYLSVLKPKEILKKGHLFTIEPGIYKPGHYGIRIEDMIYINQKGKTEILTLFPKDLIIIK